MSRLLEVRDLVVHFQTDDGLVRAVDGVSFGVDRGRVLGIVGESGSGKSVANLTVMGLTRAANAHISGEVRFDGQDLLTLPDDGMRRIRGREIGMIFQDPLSSLHPFYKVGRQLMEAVRVHHPEVSRADAHDRAVELLTLVGIPEPSRRVDDYPHEFSGGMRQRAMIAMALANDPKLLIADEPTTALDVTVQAQILDLIARLKDDLGMAVIIVTHDLGVVAETADDIAVMYAGQIVEEATAQDLFYRPEHPYTEALLGALPKLDEPNARNGRLSSIPGRPPDLLAPPEACRFAPRCKYAGSDDCTQPGGCRPSAAASSRPLPAASHRLAATLTALPM